MNDEARLKRATSKSDSRREADERRDKTFFAERKVLEAANQEKTQRLREQRIAHEAAVALLPVEAPPKKKAKR